MQHSSRPLESTLLAEDNNQETIESIVPGNAAADLQAKLLSILSNLVHLNLVEVLVFLHYHHLLEWKYQQ